jgi:deoxyribodipyrimidine photo-lyase
VITTQLPNPEQGNETEWVGKHLAGLFSGPAVASPRFFGTQAAADAALAAFDVTGYSNKRNDVFPLNKRGASGLSPWIRHGLLTLPEVWAAVKGPSRDVSKFRDELLWQEYARHVYARLGNETKQPIRYQPVHPKSTSTALDPWDRSMACMDMVMAELETDGWLVNQTRMWMASQWTVRHGADWRVGEDGFFRHLLDGSRAANRLGWQWTIGAGTGKPYGFSRWQVNKRAPGLCNTCTYKNICPIENWPEDETPIAISPNPKVGRVTDAELYSGPKKPQLNGEPEMVWITAESLGDTDPALQHHADLPVIFVFDQPLLNELQLSAKRLIFFTQRLAELATTRDLTIALGKPTDELNGIKLATTYAPVPKWQRIATHVNLLAVHPWPWLRQPSSGPVTSYSAWNRA